MQAFTRSSLSIRFIIVLLLVAAIPAILFTGLTLSLALNRVESDTTNLLHLEKDTRLQQILLNIHLVEDTLVQLQGDEAASALARRALRANRSDLGQSYLRRLIGNPEEADNFGYDTHRVLNNAMLMDLEGNIVSIETAPGRADVFVDIDLFQRNSIIFNAAQQLGTEAANSQTLTFISDSENQSIFLTHTVLDEDNTGIIGYLVNTLNLENLLYPALEVDRNEFYTSYAFLLISGENDILAPEAVTETLTNGRDVIENIRNQNVTSDNTFIEGNIQTQAQSIQIADRSLILVTEIDSSNITSSLLNQLLQIAFPLSLGSFILVVILAILLTYSITTPLERLQKAMGDIIQGIFNSPVLDARRNDEIGNLARSFEAMRAQIVELTADMSERLAQRDRDIRISQDIAHTIIQERELNTLLDNVVQLLVESFNRIYHAQIFLLDDNQDAVLRASTGEAGQQLLQRGHRLRSGSVSVIGQVVEQGQPVIARNTSVSQIHRQNEFLPETRAELAVPLKFGSQIIGALDVQSKHNDSFDEELVNILEILAAQITVAIENVRLYEQTRQQLRDLQEERNIEVREDWQDYLNTRRQPTLVSVGGVPTGYNFQSIRQQALETQQSVIGNITDRDTVPLVIPINLRGKSLGTVAIEFPAASFRYDTVLLAEELIQRLAVSLDNARLFHASQLSTERERIVNSISAKLTEHSNIEDILETAVQELGRALQTPRVGVKLNITQPPDTPDNGHQNGNADTENTA